MFKISFVAVDHEPFTQSWNEWRQKNSDFVEDMEVDNVESTVSR